MTQRYQHYKGGVYELLTTATDESTQELMVVYRSEETGRVWVRSLANFTQMVGDTPRFTLINRTCENCKTHGDPGRFCQDTPESLCTGWRSMT